jgi:hypothetical protein
MAETSIVPYAMLFPFSDFISHENIKKFGEHWPHDTVIITDGYCTTPSCECNNAGLVCQVFSAQKKEKIATMSFFVDLITHRVSSIEKSQNWNNGITPEYIVDAIKKCEPRFIQNLVERRARIRKKVLDVFGPSFLGDDSNSTEPLKPFVRTSPKIGRNEKCPCGSNKKYKHCCGI